MGKIINGVKRYLSDWRNLVAHALLGIVLLWAMFYAPISVPYRLLLLANVIIFNVWRMNREDKE